AECMEIWGGNGYIEDAPMARLYREAPVNSIWEGSGNVMCLDVLRAWAGHPELALSLSDHLLQSAADDHILQPRTRRLLQVLSDTKHNQLGAARYVAQELVLLTQALLLRQYAPQLVSDAFISSRFADDTGAVYGVRHNGMVPNAVFIRAWPWTV
ncbi:acyl-CoA dehydrogenase, partial [Photobacterium phosphoreum]|nr:acyl-CoA dehydrogenase [Photobacterium phosphoreum]